jgi:endonuclease/exonuclease/phosphatase family metal-dependent hydrolase
MRPTILFNDNQYERAEKIINTIKENNIDILLFQESFDNGITEYLLSELTEFKYKVLPINNGKLINNGLLILSKHEIIHRDHVFFNDCKGFDCFSSKGAQIITVVINDNVMQFINTHMQSDNEPKIRIKQLNDINRLLSRNYINGIKRIIIGDLNLLKNEVCNIETALCMFPLKGDYDCTWGCPDSYKESKFCEILDYAIVDGEIYYDMCIDVINSDCSDHFPLLLEFN